MSFSYEVVECIFEIKRFRMNLLLRYERSGLLPSSVTYIREQSIRHSTFILYYVSDFCNVEDLIVFLFKINIVSIRSFKTFS